jgi:hypothetical protein
MSAPIEEDRKDIHTARRGLLKAMWEASVAPRFSSKPIDMDTYLSKAKSFLQDGGSSFASDSGVESPSKDNFRQALDRSSTLTKSERDYLDQLLQSEDLDSIQQASVRLADKQVFPPARDEEWEEKRPSSPKPPLHSNPPRDSDIQQHLFRLHQETTMKPSEMLRRMSFSEQERLQRGSRDQIDKIEDNSIVAGPTRAMGSSWEEDDEESTDLKTTKTTMSPRKWNPFKDVNSWIKTKKHFQSHGDENAEMEQEEEDVNSPFLILGTSADDTSSHPHVLSPPLMEGLQAFMAESLQENNFWLKYSLVRDGPGLQNMLRHCRASKYTILAIETVHGHVFGSFTSEPWRSGDAFYGHADSFVWRMRRSRKETCQSIVERVMMESKIEVFPFTYRNQKVQMSSDDFLALGEGQLEDLDVVDGTHFGNAIRLDKSLARGSTSTSETFGNPCLIDPEQMGLEFQVSNIELWTMTANTTVAGAERAEMKSLFMKEEVQGDNKLGLIDIIVGPPNSRT